MTDILSDAWLLEQTGIDADAPTIGELVARAIDEAPLRTAYTIEVPEENDEQREYLGASIIGRECERSLWYSFRHFTAPDFPPRIRRRFETGHIYECRVIAALKRAGFEVQDRADDGEQYRVLAESGLFQGHMDGKVRGQCLGDAWHVLEVKAMVSAKYVRDDDGEPSKNKSKGVVEGAWFALRRKGVRFAKKEHYCQMITYMALEGLSAALYIAVNTDTDQLHVEVVPFMAEHWEHIRRRIKRVLYGGEAPQRVADNPAAFVCRYCDHRLVCHSGREPAQKSCRQCVHAKVTAGKWSGQGCNFDGPCEKWQRADQEGWE